MTPILETPESYHVVALANGMVLYVDTDVRCEIEAAIRDEDPFVDFDTVLNEEVRLVVAYIAMIFSSTPDSRASDRAMDRMKEQEEL